MKNEKQSRIPPAREYQLRQRRETAYRYLPFIDEISVMDREKLIDGLDQQLIEEDLKWCFEALFINRDSQDVLRDCGMGIGIELEEPIRALTRKHAVRAIMPYLWDCAYRKEKKLTEGYIREKYKLGLSLLLSQTSLIDIAEGMEEKIKREGYFEAQYTVAPAHKTWSLCMESEKYLIRAMDNSEVVLADGAMLTKVGEDNGYTTSVCLYPVITPRSILIPGIWYSPVDQRTKNIIEDTYNDNKTHVKTPSNSVWAINRSLKARHIGQGSSTKLLHELRGAMHDLPLKRS